MNRFVTTLLFLTLIFSVAGNAAENSTRLGLVPEPVEMKINSGNFSLSAKSRIVFASEEPQVEQVAGMLGQQLFSLSEISVKPEKSSATTASNTICLMLNSVKNQETGSEGYTLTVSSKQIKIAANEPAGLFYGVQTLLQLVPPVKATGPVAVPCVEITDYPRFAWRGLMLDVSRHFFSKEFVKRYIDQMAKYKMNVFHWHLTDNQGWRIEIKGLPELTETGAWRVPRTGRFWTFEPPAPGERTTDGGYYTQEDIKEVVEYASQRFVTIVPEIDVPGHSEAFIASYPDASCTGLQYPVNAGFPHDKDDIVLCAGNEDNFKKLEIIFSQVASLFPGKYIHIGGDEAGKNFWEKCPKCQQRMKDEHLKNEEELQSYFIKRIEKMLLAKGKTLIGWDEILEGGLAPSAVVMSWRGIAGGIEAARQGHPSVMSPNEFCYINQPQGELAIERVNAGGSLITVSKAYSYEPVPDGVDAKYILGGQGNLWSEFVCSQRMAEYMTWPRGLALSEIFWSPKEKRNWPDFAIRMEKQFPRFEKDEVNYSPSVYDPYINPVKAKDGRMEVTFATELKDLDVYYTFDCTFPDKFSAKYNGEPIQIPKGSSEIWAISHRDGKPIGRLLVISLDELKGRM